MATASFRSATGRSSVGKGREAAPSAGGASKSSRSGTNRRSRSLGRYSGRFPPTPPGTDDFATPRSRFVNKVRGAGVPEVSVDDLAEEFFRARAESDEESDVSCARNRGRSSVASYLRGTESSRQRGRSVSRPPDRQAVLPKGVPDRVSRRRRSVSVARHRYSESENDVESQSSSIKSKSKTSCNNVLQLSSSHRAVKNGVLSRSMSQKDFYHSQDNYSSHSSSLTDDEARDFRSGTCGDEKTFQTIYVQEKLRATKESSEYSNGNNIQPKSSEALETIVEIRRNYTTKLEQSEKRKQELLAQLAWEEERGQELCKIVKDLLPSTSPAVPERQLRSRRRSNDKTRMSNRLTEEAEQYLADFLSNVEDTDISSFDGERSDTSSSIRDLGSNNFKTVTHDTLMRARPVPADADGVLLPWLQWETSTSPFSPCKDKPGVPISTGNNSYAAAATMLTQEAGAEISNDSKITSSLGSWSPGGIENSSMASHNRSQSKFRFVDHHSNGRTSASSFDMDEYLNLKRTEDLLFERLIQRRRIESGGIILCGGRFLI
ncbi:uncharacterized protein LOC122056155 [Zingiber officinale]|uniref:uncharacterized protein LOC122056155 n=1 Tax=Zingiber officinale TaxID=94328 RepID=UPI001C4ACEF3|nr:uncharacterized protein LOC122056155 [Zingiber officinale]